MSESEDTEDLDEDPEKAPDETTRPYSRKNFGGRDDGISWTRMALSGVSIRVPSRCTQFALRLHPKYGAPGTAKWIVVRADTLEQCPADETRSWPSEHHEIGPALREAVERQEAWTTLAIELLGQANAEASQGQPQTLFERRALESLRSGDHSNGQTRPSRARKDHARLQAKRRKVKYPAPEQPALPAPSDSDSDSSD